ncbi:hypothetical protein P152DRAFT_453720 [Eremomyces bilateralis CBS 781.70]|uniref:Magnesium transporter n=1 Tax=Eremomyces bilateralis CBS 781.70 TaxID=1392243 RepID=A0A6G1GGX6_9PEZI|nr:uncharacterized protein P152DRAFT_453720 [Eremomyces bilateralis CBS 781.70]KAF1817120.1 hypothetical protein P152DRAFT_453720 [Eremomyces bilateralis CBS 781.70]
MTLTSTTLNAAGLLLLSHSVYSAWEHSSTTPPHPASSPFATSTSTLTLPLDITLELLLSLFLLCTGIILHSAPLRPIRWRAWAEQIEKDQSRPEGRKAIRAPKGEMVAHPFRFLEERRGFLDIRAKRMEFADWVRQAGPEVQT